MAKGIVGMAKGSAPLAMGKAAALSPSGEAQVVG